MMRAYQAAKGRSKKKGNHPDFVQFCEFRLLLEYLGRYFELKVMFDRIDVSDDNRISFEEWEQVLNGVLLPLNPPPPPPGITHW